MAKTRPNLYLQIWGGLGARINTLLSVLHGLDANNLPHQLSISWPMNNEYLDSPAGHSDHRESLFAIHLQDLYDIKRPIKYIEPKEFAVYSTMYTSYSLTYTQAPSRDPLFRGQIHFNTQPHDESFCIAGHQWMNIDGLHARILPKFKTIFERNMSLKPQAQRLVDSLMLEFNRTERVVGLYIRQSTIHPAVSKWDAMSRMLPVFREEAERDLDTKFFVCCDDHKYLTILRDELKSVGNGDAVERVITVPKPGKFNDPEEMLNVTADIELMRHVDVFYPTWNSGLGILMAALRGEEFDRYGNTTTLGSAVFAKSPDALCHTDVSPVTDGGWLLQRETDI